MSRLLSASEYAALLFLFSLLKLVYSYLADTSILRLCFIAIALCFARQYEPAYAGLDSDSHKWARRLGVLALLCFGLTAYAVIEPPRAELGHYLMLAMRSVLTLMIVEGSAATVLPAVFWLWRAIRRKLRSFRRHQGSEQIDRVMLAIREDAMRRPQPTPPPDPAATLKASIEKIKAEYEVSCEALRAAGLDSIELETALEFARQKYLRRLHEAMRK